MKKFFLSASLFITLASCLGLMGCSDNDDSSESKQKAMVAILKTTEIDYWHQVAQGFSDECKANGLVPIIYFTHDEKNANEQVEAVGELEGLGYDIQGIAYAPIWTGDNHQAEQAVADFASRHNIPVTIVDSPIDTKESPLKDIYVSYVGTDNKTAGQELAKHISGPAESILVVRDGTSTPTFERYQGIFAEKGKGLKLWDTDASGIKEITEHFGPDIKNIVFLNGHLCKEVLDVIGIYDVYTFDIYNEYAPLVEDDTFLKGILAQNSLEMGHKCVTDLLSRPQIKDHFIPTIYCDKESITDIPEEAEPLFNYLQQNSPFKGKSVLLVLGSDASTYWHQICAGAEEKAEKMYVNVKAVYGKSDTDSTTCPNAIENCAETPNLIGVAGQISRKALDDACAKIPEGVNLTLIEGICYKGGISENRYNGIVSINNAHYAQEFLSHIKEKKLLVLSYSNGNNVTLTEEYIKLRGDDIRPIYLHYAAAAADSLMSVNLDDYDAVILNSGNFVSGESMECLKGKTVYSSDLNETVASHIRSGAITLNISPDTFMFGRLVLLSAVTGASYEVPYIITSKDNVDTPEREKYLK